MFHFFNQTKLDSDTIQRIGNVLMCAAEHNDHGVANWAARALADGNALGKLRDRDLATLERLEGTYSHEFYRNGGIGQRTVYA